MLVYFDVRGQQGMNFLQEKVLLSIMDSYFGQKHCFKTP